MQKHTKTIIVTQILLILAVLVLAYFISPRGQNPTITGHSFVEFNSLNSEYILIDKTPEFLSPIRVNLSDGKAVLYLEPGVYYWKPVGIVEGFGGKFIVESEVGLELKNSSVLSNSGNVPVRVSTSSEDGIVILGVEVETIVNGTLTKTIYRGEQYE